MGPRMQRDGDSGNTGPAQDFKAGRGLHLGKTRWNGPYGQGFSVGRQWVHGAVALFSSSAPTSGYEEQDSQCQAIFTVAAIKHVP